MDAPPDVRFRDRALLLEDVLVVADLHLGKGTSGGFELPVGDGADMLDRLRSLLSAHDPREVVVAGDLLHSFRTIPRAVEDTLAGIEEAVSTVDADLVVTPGNHDTMLQGVYDGATPDHYRVGDTVICHGHRAPAVSARRYVVGHDHPTIEIEGRRRPCFLFGSGPIASEATRAGAGDGGNRGRDDEHETRTEANDGSEETPGLIMLPAFNRLLRGVAVNDMGPGDFQAPLCQAADRLAPVVRDDRADETLVFPTLGEFRHRL
ncbi:MAG: metallophosphoesterase [Haloarculaceae archaeon]